MKKTNNHSHKGKIILALVIAILIVILFICSCLYVLIYKRTCAYNEAITRYNEIAHSYSLATDKTSVENIEGLYNDAPELPVADTSFKTILSSVFHGNTVKKINKDIQTLDELTKQLENDFSLVQQLTDPNEKWVMEHLQNVEGIGFIEAVSKENDPNKQLNKQNGYTACIYFTLDQLNSYYEEKGKAIEKGTDGGGCIEVYRNSGDAQNRCDYLAGFDNTLLYSGSYALVGTMVIRLSYRLDTDSQFEMTDRIVKAFIH